jgi:hypothetical protein
MGGRVGACALWGLVVAVVSAAVAAPGAGAATVVSGERDSNASLVVDPSSDPSDPLIKQTASSTETLFFIQRMPVAKRINSLTMGNLGLAAGCSTGTVEAQIWEHEGGAWSGASNTRFYSSANAALPAVPGKVTWSFPASTLRKGHAYSFHLHSSGCAAMKYTTWSHDQSQVEGGPLACEQAPIHQRMWHVGGAEDAQWACVSNGEPARWFKASMPSGWLVSRRPATAWDIMGGSYLNGTSPDATACIHSGSRYPRNLGASWFVWRATPSNPTTHTDYVCKWSQFGPPGEEIEDGWFYALPWLTERNGAPRSMYLKLDTIDYDALLEDYAPVIRYDVDEDLHAISPGAATDFYDGSDDPDDPDDANRLMDAGGAFASANQSVALDQGIDVLNLDYLGSEYTGAGPRGSTDAQPTDHLSERGDGTWGPFFSSDGFADDSAVMEGLPGYANRVYGRVAHGDDGKIWLQYWLFYYFDSQGNLGQYVHEGDWEMVQVGLNSSNSPDKAAYAQHGDGELCNWSTDVETYTGRPIVYVAQGSHASYFHAGHYDDPDPDDDAGGDGIEVTSPSLVQIRSQDPAWVGWPGSWGDTAESPPGPAFQGTKWDDPSTWADGLYACNVD